MRRPGIDRKLDSDAGSSSRQKSRAPESAVAPAPTGEKMKKQRAAAAAVLMLSFVHLGDRDLLVYNSRAQKLWFISKPENPGLCAVYNKAREDATRRDYSVDVHEARPERSE